MLRISLLQFKITLPYSLGPITQRGFRQTCCYWQTLG